MRQMSLSVFWSEPGGWLSNSRIFVKMITAISSAGTAFKKWNYAAS